MEDDPTALGSKVIDSNEVRRKQISLAGSSMFSTPQCYSVLSSDVRDTPCSAAASDNLIHSKLLNPGVVLSTPTRYTPFNPLDLYQKSSNPSSTQSQNLIPNSSNHINPEPTGVVRTSEGVEGLQSQKLKNPDSHPTQVQALNPNSHSKDSMMKPTTNEALSRQSQEESTTTQVLYNARGAPYDAKDPNLGYPSDAIRPRYNSSKPILTSQPALNLTMSSEPKASGRLQGTEQLPRAVHTKNWSSLFKAQAPAKSMRLEHYPEFQKGKEAHIAFDESQLDDGIGKHCLVGHFLDGKMPIPLLTATARTVWKDHGKFSIKQLGSSYLFEFDDEASKLAVLEGGPYFFSRRYLVLKEWKRMMTPGKIHPPTIPVWVKLHRLPLEFWTHVGFSKIASTIGKPIYVDEATANKKRLDFARICVEIDAGDELPSDITISVKSDSVMVGVEYQWLPPSCKSCKVFGHSCGPKAVPKQTNPNEEWRVVGKNKPTPTSLQTDNQAATTESMLQQLGQEEMASQPIILQTQSETQHCLVPSLVAACATDTASSSNPIGIDTTKPTALLSPHIPQPLLSLPNTEPPDPPAQDHPSADGTLSEEVDEEFIIQDEEWRLPIMQDKDRGQLSPFHNTKTGSTITNSGSPSIKESSSSKKKRLKKERKLRNQGST